MSKGRLEAFSDGVFAIIITITVLDLKVPHEATLSGLRSVLPQFLSYALSFTYVGIYWTNHHHMLQATRRVNGAVLWANLLLLFWLSLTPFVTSWLGENPQSSLPVAIYGADFFLCGISFLILQRTILALEGEGSLLARAVGGEVKEITSQVGYVLAIGLAFVRPWISEVIYAAVALMWVVPDPRIERQVSTPAAPGDETRP
jgi:uncharacterized membrane protein